MLILSIRYNQSLLWYKATLQVSELISKNIFNKPLDWKQLTEAAVENTFCSREAIVCSQDARKKKVLLKLTAQENFDFLTFKRCISVFMGLFFLQFKFRQSSQSSVGLF